jgi:hypothetical protein
LITVFEHRGIGSVKLRESHLLGLLEMAERAVQLAQLRAFDVVAGHVLTLPESPGPRKQGGVGLR